jgi:hypothetical protein
MGYFQTFLTISATGIAVLYLGWFGHQIYSLFHPEYSFKDVPSDATLFKNAWSEVQRFNLDLYVTTPSENVIVSGPDKMKPILGLKGLSFGDAHETTLNVSLPPHTLNNGSLRLHCFLYTEGAELELSSSKFKATNVRYSNMWLTRYLPVQKNETRNLITDGADTSTSEKEEPPVILSHWKPSLNIQLVNDRTVYPWGYFPGDFFPYLTLDEENNVYSPILYLNELHLRRDHYIPVNKTKLLAEVDNEEDAPTLPLKISFQTVTLGWFRLTLQMAGSFDQMRTSSLGHSEKEIDNLRQMFFETSPYLLGATIIASVLHLLFDFLAFKSDISHWKAKKTMEGVSRSSILMNMFSSIVVMFYLWDRREETSILVSGGAICSAAGWFSAIVFDPSAMSLNTAYSGSMEVSQGL